MRRNGKLNPRSWFQRRAVQPAALKAIEPAPINMPSPIVDPEYPWEPWPPDPINEVLRPLLWGVPVPAGTTLTEFADAYGALARKTAQAEETTMSFITDLETFASKAEKELEKLWSKAPTLVQVAETTLEYCIPLVETAIGIIDPAAEAAAVIVLNAIEQKLVAVKGVIKAVGVNLTVVNVLSGIQSDLNDFLAATDIKGVTAIADLNLVLGELQAMITSFETAAARKPVEPAAA